MKDLFTKNNSINLHFDVDKIIESFVLSTIFNNNQAVMLVVDSLNHKIIDSNGAAEEFYGYTRNKLLTMDMCLINIVHDLLSRFKWTPSSLFSVSEKIIHSLKHLIPADRTINTIITQSSVFLDADQSHSMAVIINNLFTNCIEHAFLDGQEIRVNIEIREKKEEITCIYKDNGPGFSEKVLKSESYNVGLYPIKNIAEDDFLVSEMIEGELLNSGYGIAGKAIQLSEQDLMILNELKEKNRQLWEASQFSETMMKEIDHRVKNNFQLISGFLKP